MSAGRILIVEDESIVRLHLAELLVQLDYEVVGDAADAENALAQAEALAPDIVLMDIRLRGGEDGVEVAHRIIERLDCGIVFVTAFADSETVARTRTVGALGYVVKPYSAPELRAVLATAMALRAQLGSGRALTPPPASVASAVPRVFHGLLAVSDSMQQLMATVQRVATITWPVLIEGETGTGKELVARAIHDSSPRAAGPFIAVNCAALTESLVGSTFFGHRKGAFTSASSDQLGVFEAADRGTLFLDEIADIPLSAQSALLRLLEEKAVRRIGETRERRVDVRILSATQRDLAKQAEAGRFRPDLLFRLRALRVIVPPLRERPTDIPLLARHFLEGIGRELGRGGLEFERDALQRLCAHRWPGNVRELRHAIEHAALNTDGARIRCENLPPELLAGSAEDALAGGERERILQALSRAGGSRVRAAQILGISRATLYRRFQELQIDPDTPSR